MATSKQIINMDKSGLLHVQNDELSAYNNSLFFLLLSYFMGIERLFPLH